MLRYKSTLPRAIAAAALIAACTASAEEASIGAALEPRVLGEALVGRSLLERDVLIEPPPALVRFHPAGQSGREHVWNVAAHASAGTDARVQRAFFVSAHIRF